MKKSTIQSVLQCTVCTAKQSSNESGSETTQHVELCVCKQQYTLAAKTKIQQLNS